MNFLEERILKEATVKKGNVLNVEAFLNHQVDTALMEQMAEEFCRRFAGLPITKVLTLETSGIAVAYPVARLLGVPLVFARKTKTSRMSDAHMAQVENISNKKAHVVVSKSVLTAEDRVLIIDDILSAGFTLQALISLVDTAGAAVEGLGIAIEKGFEEGGWRIRNLGFRLESLAVIQSMDESGVIRFQE